MLNTVLGKDWHASSVSIAQQCCCRQTEEQVGTQQTLPTGVVLTLSDSLGLTTLGLNTSVDSSV